MDEDKSRAWTVYIAAGASIVAALVTIGAAVLGPVVAGNYIRDENLLNARQSAYADYFGTLDRLTRLAPAYTERTTDGDVTTDEVTRERWLAAYDISTNQAAAVQVLSPGDVNEAVAKLQDDLSKITELAYQRKTTNSSFAIESQRDNLLLLAQDEIKSD